MSGPAAYASLFLSAFLAATVFPAQSELLLGALALKGGHDPLALIAVAGAGNVAGSCLNWFLGRQARRIKQCRWFPLDRSALEKAGRRFHRYGRWSLLLSWVPVIGDPLTWPPVF